MASAVGICNGALQLIGARRITSLSEESDNARECNLAYERERDKLLRRYPWQFAITRKTLAPLADEPEFGFDYQFAFPSDCLRPLRDADVDWRLEGNKILTDEGDELELRYVRRVEDPNEFDPLFIDALEKAVALQIVERRTQSNVKRDRIELAYREAIAEARRVGAIEKAAQDWQTDDWILARL